MAQVSIPYHDNFDATPPIELIQPQTSTPVLMEDESHQAQDLTNSTATDANGGEEDDNLLQHSSSTNSARHDFSSEVDQTSRNSGETPNFGHDIPPPSDPAESHHWRGGYRKWISKSTIAWGWELSGIILSLACIVSITAVLPYLHERPVSKWDLLIAPNTIISTFITITKTSMLLVVAEAISQLKWSYFRTQSHPIRELEHFDRASRGPWGSFIFLCRLRRRALLASLGAFIMVTALGMEPFGQQIISFETRYISRDGEVGTIPVTFAYTTQEESQNNVMQGAMLGGLYETDHTVPVVCPSGNCTWEEFSTLGLCSICTNVTDDIRMQCGMTFNLTMLDVNGTSEQHICTATLSMNGTEAHNCTRWPQESPGGQHTYSWIVSMRLEYLPPTNTSMYTQEWCGASQDPMWTTTNTGPTPSPFLAASTPAPGHPNISDLYLATLRRKKKTRSWTEGTTWSLKNCSSYHVIEAMECQIYWCQKSHDSSDVTNGTGSQVLPYDFPLRSQSEGFVPDTSEPNHGARVPNHSTFQIGSSQMSYISRLFENLFDINDTPINGTLDARSALIMHKNISQAVSDMADSMTVKLRTGPDSTKALGKVYFPETYIIVHWQWFLLPGSLVILSAVFFGLTIHYSTRQTPLWRSSLLPLLFHGLEGWEASELRVEDQSSMDTAAERMDARLSRNMHGDRRLLNSAGHTEPEVSE